MYSAFTDSAVRVELSPLRWADDCYYRVEQLKVCTLPNSIHEDDIGGFIQKEHENLEINVDVLGTEYENGRVLRLLALGKLDMSARYKF